MDFAQQQRSPTKHLVGLSFVAVLHIVLIYALVNGLATKVIELVKPPVETKILEDQKPPPPPEVKLPPPPKMIAPPPPYIPPPEVQVQTPPPEPSITSTQVAPPKQAFAPPVPQATVAQAGPKGVAGNCSNVQDVKGMIAFPAKALRANIAEGHADVSFTISGGTVGNLEVKASNRLFAEPASDAVRHLKCQDGTYRWQIDFKAGDE